MADGAVLHDDASRSPASLKEKTAALGHSPGRLNGTCRSGEAAWMIGMWRGYDVTRRASQPSVCSMSVRGVRGRCWALLDARRTPSQREKGRFDVWSRRDASPSRLGCEAALGTVPDRDGLVLVPFRHADGGPRRGPMRRRKRRGLGRWPAAGGLCLGRAGQESKQPAQSRLEVASRVIWELR